MIEIIVRLCMPCAVELFGHAVNVRIRSDKQACKRCGKR